MFNLVSVSLFVVVVCIVLPEPILGDCWDTECQLDTLVLRGCELYNRYEAGQKYCDGGTIYTCCSYLNLQNEHEEQPGPDCLDTACQLHTWNVTGCEQYNRYEAGRKQCHEGTIFRCCIDPEYPVVTYTGYYGDLTWYDLGLTACGRNYTNNDYVAALAFGHFTTPNPNVDPICGRQIKITDPLNQRSIVVQVEDKCAGCGIYDVDVSPSAFKALRPLDVGRFKVNWNFI